MMLEGDVSDVMIGERRSIEKPGQNQDTSGTLAQVVFNRIH